MMLTKGCTLAEQLINEGKVSNELDSIYMFVLTIDLTKICQRICVASRDYNCWDSISVFIKLWSTNS